MAGIEFAKGFHRGVIVAEEFDEGTVELAGAGAGGEEGGDPAIVAGEAAAGGGNGAMEGAEFSGSRQLGDLVFVFLHAEAGVTAVGGIDKDAEEGFAEGGIESADDGTEFGEGGEILEFAGTEKFDVPMLHTGVGKAGFLVGAEVELDVLGDASLEFLVVFRGLTFHPGFDGGRVDFFHAVALGSADAVEELREGGILVVGIHGVDSSDHHDDLGFETEGDDSLQNGVGFFRESGAEG